MHNRPVTLVKAELEVLDPLASHGSGQRRLVPGDGQTGLHIVNTEYVARGMPQKGLVAEAIHGLQRTVEQGQAPIAVDDANALLVGLGQHAQLLKRMRFGHRRVGRVLGGDLFDMGRACQKPRPHRPGRKHQHQDHGIQPGIRSRLRQGHRQPDPQCHHGQGEHQRAQTPTARHRRVQNQALQSKANHHHTQGGGRGQTHPQAHDRPTGATSRKNAHGTRRHKKCRCQLHACPPRGAGMAPAHQHGGGTGCEQRQAQRPATVRPCGRAPNVSQYGQRDLQHLQRGESCPQGCDHNAQPAAAQ